MLKVIYEDADVIVVWKPAGMESQESRGLSADMVSEIRKHLCLEQRNARAAGAAPERSRRTELSTKLSPEDPRKPESVYVGVIHRLDKPVSGLLIYAKNKTAAARLSAQFAGGKTDKRYLAVLCGKVDKSVDNYVDYLLKDSGQNCSRIVDKETAGGKLAKLSCRVLEEREDEEFGTLTLAEISLKTGRHHQIRVQLSGHGLPLWGDQKYNPAFAGASCRGNVALASYRISFTHPTTGERLTFCSLPDSGIFRSFAFCGGESGKGKPEHPR